MMKQQNGAAMVEFALVALLFFVVLFGIIEIGRWMFNWNTMVEATRRGARIAAVCPLGDPYIAIATVFGSSADPDNTNVNSPIVNGLHTSDVAIVYYKINDDGTLACVDSVRGACDGNTPNAAERAEIQLVEVNISYNNTTHPTPGPLRTFLTPFVGNIFGQLNPPTFRTIIPKESAGALQASPNLCY